MKIQHLVLDDDVHKALKARKKKFGITVKEFGNSALRAALRIPTRQELIVEKLVASGKITRQDYEQAVAAATRDLKAGRTNEAITPPPDGTPITVGSWRGQTIHLDPDGRYALFFHRSSDGKKTLSPPHEHSEAHSWALVLQGKVLWQIGGEERVLGPGEAVHIPPGVVHNSAPLTRSTTMLMLMSPPEATPRDTLSGPGAKKRKTQNTPRKER